MKTKTTITFAAFMFFCSLFLKAQETKTDTLTVFNDTIDAPEYPVYELPEIFTTDNNLRLIGQYIPTNWVVTHSTDTLKFRHISPIYRISDSLAADTVKKGRAKLKGLTTIKHDTAYILILLEPLWSGQKVDDALLKNSHFNAQIDKLLKKYKIAHLKEFIDSDDFNIDSETLSVNEKKSIIRYLADKAALEKELILVPNYHTTMFSLFIVKVFPTPEEAMHFTPPGVVMETALIIELFEKYAGK